MSGTGSGLKFLFHRLQLMHEFIAVTPRLIDLARFRPQMSLAADGRVLQMLRPAPELARDLFGKRFQI